MKSRIIKKSILPLVLMVFLCGCQEAPKEVQERMEHYGENSQIQDVEINYCTVAELRDADMAKLDISLDNMVLPKKVDFSGIEKLAILDMSVEEGELEDRERYLKLFEVKEDSEVSKEVRDLDGIVEYDDTGEKKYMAVGENGFVSYFAGSDYEPVDEETQKGEAVEKYDLDMDDITGTMVAYEDGERELSTYLDTTEEWLEEIFPMEQCRYHISDVYVRERKAAGISEKSISFFAETLFGGVRLNSYGFSYDEGRMNLVNYGFNINCDSSGKITFFSTGEGRLRLDSSDEVKQVVDLKTAILLVNQKMSGFNELEIHKLIPLYALYPKYASEDEKVYESGQEVEGRPCYAFLIENGEDDSTLGIHKSNRYHFIYVDMVTGDIITSMELE